MKRRPQHGLRRRGTEIGVVQHDRRIVATQFEGHSLNRLGGIRHDVAGGRNAAGESDLSPIWMGGGGIADLLRQSRDDVDGAERQPCANIATDRIRASGQVSGGLSTTQWPSNNAATIGVKASTTGEFQGTIDTTTP